MPVSVGDALTVLTLIVSLLILAVSAWNLYLSHYKEKRSEINLLPEDSEQQPAFAGGNHAIDESASWNANFSLKVVNTGDKSAYVRETTHSLEGLKKDGEIESPGGAEIETSRATSNWVGDEIEPHSSKRYRLRIRIEPETDLGVLVDNDSAIIRHTMVVEDNKGSYEVVHETEIRLVGPEGAIENWEEHLQKDSK